MKNIILFLVICSCVQIAFSQQKIEVKSKIKGKVLNTNTGILLLKTSKEILGINPHSKNVVWRNKSLKKQDLESYQEIPLTPLVVFEKKPLVSSKLLSNALGAKGLSRVILNVSDGRTLFNSEKQGFIAVNKTLLIPEQRAILVDGVKKKKAVLALYDYHNNEFIWENDLTNSAFFTSVKEALLGTEKIMLDKDGYIYWLKNKYLLKINKATGEIIFKQKGVHRIEMNNVKDVLFVFTDKIALKNLNEETAIIAYNTKTMKPVWSNPVKVLGNITHSFIVDERMVVITSKGFNVVNKLGEKQWKATEPLPFIKRVVPVENGYLIVQEKNLLYINKKGKKAWKKPVKISLSADEDPIHLFYEGQYVMYITPSMANRIHLLTGDVLDEEIKFDKSNIIVRNLKLKEHFFRVWHNQNNKQFPVYNENDFYLLNGKEKLSSSIYTFDFDKDIPELEIRKGGYFIQGNNKFYLFDFKGTLTYKVEYPSNNNISFFDKSINVVERGVGTYSAVVGFAGRQVNKTLKNVLITQDLGFVTNSVSSIYGSYQSYQGSINNLKKMNGLGFNSNLTQIFERYKKGKDTDDILFTVDENTLKKILRLSKDSGHVTMLKEIDENQGDFIVDEVENLIYFFTKKTIVIEDL